MVMKRLADTGSQGGGSYKLYRSGRWKPTWLVGGWAVCHPSYGVVTLTATPTRHATRERAEALCESLNRIYDA